MASALPAQAQSRAIGLSSVAIDLWPEYDRPTMLVQIFGTLDSGVALPAEVVVRLPAASGEPHAVAALAANGVWLDAPYTHTVSGDQILVTLLTDTANFKVEYYDPTLTVSGAARTFAFRWTTNYAVADAGVRVQAPVDSSQLTGNPALTALGPGDYGLDYYTLSWGALAAGQEVRLDLSYSKSSSTLSCEKLATCPGKASPAPALTFFDSPWLWGGVAGGLLVAGVAIWGLWWLRTSQNEIPRISKGRRRRTGRPNQFKALGGARDAAPGRVVAFCTQCGRRRLPGDRFCRSCGAPVRE